MSKGCACVHRHQFSNRKIKLEWISMSCPLIEIEKAHFCTTKSIILCSLTLSLSGFSAASIYLLSIIAVQFLSALEGNWNVSVGWKLAPFSFDGYVFGWYISHSFNWDGTTHCKYSIQCLCSVIYYCALIVWYFFRCLRFLLLKMLNIPDKGISMASAIYFSTDVLF